MSEEKEFIHLILCRYNYLLYESNPYKIKNTEHWMEDRLVKFEKLLNSLEKQTNKNFEFVLFIDFQTPNHQKTKIYDFLKSKLPTVKYHICENKIGEFFKKLEKKTKFLMTSRIDNDDEYLPKFVEEIQNSFSGVEEVLDVNGIQFEVGTSKKYTSGRSFLGSPFVTLVEKHDNIKTVFIYKHNDMCKYYKCRCIGQNEVLYIQNVHDNNISNKILGSPI